MGKSQAISIPSAARDGDPVAIAEALLSQEPESLSRAQEKAQKEKFLAHGELDPISLQQGWALAPERKLWLAHELIHRALGALAGTPQPLDTLADWLNARPARLLALEFAKALASRAERQTKGFKTLGSGCPPALARRVIRGIASRSQIVERSSKRPPLRGLGPKARAFLCLQDTLARLQALPKARAGALIEALGESPLLDLQEAGRAAVSKALLRTYAAAPGVAFQEFAPHASARAWLREHFAEHKNSHLVRGQRLGLVWAHTHPCQSFSEPLGRLAFAWERTALDQAIREGQSPELTRAGRERLARQAWEAQLRLFQWCLRPFSKHELVEQEALASLQGFSASGLLRAELFSERELVTAQIRHGRGNAFLPTLQFHWLMTLLEQGHGAGPLKGGPDALVKLLGMEGRPALRWGTDSDAQRNADFDRMIEAMQKAGARWEGKIARGSQTSALALAHGKAKRCKSMERAVIGALRRGVSPEHLLRPVSFQALRSTPGIQALVASHLERQSLRQSLEEIPEQVMRRALELAKQELGWGGPMKAAPRARL